MSCNDCVFRDQLLQHKVAIPCNSCQADSNDKGFCVASRSVFGYVPIITKIDDLSHANEIIARARTNGTILDLLQWSREKNAFCPA